MQQCSSAAAVQEAVASRSGNSSSCCCCCGAASSAASRRLEGHHLWRLDPGTVHMPHTDADRWLVVRRMLWYIDGMKIWMAGYWGGGVSDTARCGRRGQPTKAIFGDTVPMPMPMPVEIHANWRSQYRNCPCGGDGAWAVVVLRCAGLRSG